MTGLILRDPVPHSVVKVRQREYIGDTNEIRLSLFRDRVKNEGGLGNEVLIVACSDSHPTPKLSTLSWGGTKLPFTVDVGEVFEVPVYADSILQKHCLVFVDGFYVNRKDPKNGRVPYFVQSIFGEPFALAGIWRVWKGQDGNLFSGCSILLWDVSLETKMGYMNNAALKSPIILSRENERAWLATRTKTGAMGLLGADSNGLIQAHTVSPAVNLKNSDPYNPILTTHIAYTDIPII